MWRVLLDHYAGAASSARELVVEPGFASLRIAEINRLNAGHDYLQSVPGLTHSEYPEEDIQALSYEDGTFDLVLTSDTLEHVPDYRAALRETRRILRPGGRHIFTVPLRPDLRTTRDRNGMKPIYHGEAPGPLALLRRPGEDMRALHDFAWDFKGIVVEAGFDLELHAEGVESVFCATVRRVEPQRSENEPGGAGPPARTWEMMSSPSLDHGRVRARVAAIDQARQGSLPSGPQVWPTAA